MVAPIVPTQLTQNKPNYQNRPTHGANISNKTFHTASAFSSSGMVALGCSFFTSFLFSLSLDKKKYSPAMSLNDTKTNVTSDTLR